jgi:deoxyribodipyrimidine photolyase-related protein
VKTLRVVLGDQLTRGLASLRTLTPGDIVLMMEVHEEATHVAHHKQKIVFIFSAMRHFAEELRSEGVSVDYVRLDDPANTGSFSGEVARAVRRHGPDCIEATEPGEWRVLKSMRAWERDMGLPVALHDDDRFFASRARFSKWAEDRKSFRMEFFYREMRRESGLLMAGDEPVGGQWNFDHDNRKALPKHVRPPKRKRFEPDAVTRDVMALVATRFGHHFGDLEPFGWAVTCEGALEALDHFISQCLPSFGDYQDAMKAGNVFLYHSVISPYLNVGLLTAREVCEAAEAAYESGAAPLNAVEGFIRQILGWREYVRGIYWLKMPDYVQSNALQATRPLPRFYWTGDTDMNCMKQAIGDTRRHAYAHHIQRLMITGNFALLAGLAPREVEEWYLLVYADAFEWVELPNTHGMALFADGGLLASKPYAASGAYIDRMSDYCADCSYDPKVKLGEKACPFNILYWDFLIRNEERLGKNPRLAMPYRTLAKMTAERRKTIAAEALAFLDSMADVPCKASQLILEL